MFPIIIIYAVIITLIGIPLCYWMYFKIKNPFWGCQPVNHSHHFYRKYMKPFIIEYEFYNHKFINPLQIKTQAMQDFSYHKEFQQFIQEHFCNNSSFKYLPTYSDHIEPYFKDDKNAYVSTYRMDGLIVGTITNRSVHIVLPDNNKFLVSYIDFLCVHKGQRKRNVAPELIQTHEHFQRSKSNKKCLVSLFKKEGKLHNFIPLVKYTTFSYDLTKQTQIHRQVIPAHLKLTWFSLSTFKKILPHLEYSQNPKSFFLISPIECLMNLVERKSIQVCGVLDMNTQECVASYWFRDTGFYVDSDKPNLECFASLWNKEKMSLQAFKSCFLEALIKISSSYHLLQLEATGNNCILSRMPWKKEYETLCAYYLYNYSHKTIKADDIAIII